MGRRCAEAGRDVISKIVSGADFFRCGLGGDRHRNCSDCGRGSKACRGLGCRNRDNSF